MDFYATTYSALKRENVRLLRELNKNKIQLKEALARLEILQRKLGGYLSRLVPKNVIECLRRKLKRESESAGRKT